MDPTDPPTRAAARALSPRDARDGWWFWIRRSASVLLLGVVVLLAVAAVGIPAVTGAKTYTIAGGSMEPRLPFGSLVVVQPVDPWSIATGDVITFQVESGKPTVATHRVVGFEDGSAGERRFVTKGDANDSPDAATVQVGQLQGRLWYVVPYVGYVNTVLSGSTRAIIVPIVAVALLGYGVWMLVTGVRARRRGNRSSVGRRPRSG